MIAMTAIAPAIARLMADGWALLPERAVPGWNGDFRWCRAFRARAALPARGVLASRSWFDHSFSFPPITAHRNPPAFTFSPPLLTTQPNYGTSNVKTPSKLRPSGKRPSRVLNRTQSLTAL